MTAHKRRYTTQPFALCKLSYNGFGVYKKFWIDPQNGATLKYIEKGDGKDYEFELTQYSLLGPLWNNALRPEPYSSARRP